MEMIQNCWNYFHIFHIFVNGRFLATQSGNQRIIVLILCVKQHLNNSVYHRGILWITLGLFVKLLIASFSRMSCVCLVSTVSKQKKVNDVERGWRIRLSYKEDIYCWPKTVFCWIDYSR